MILDFSKLFLSTRQSFDQIQIFSKQKLKKYGLMSQKLFQRPSLPENLPSFGYWQFQ